MATTPIALKIREVQTELATAQRFAFGPPAERDLALEVVSKNLAELQAMTSAVKDNEPVLQHVQALENSVAGLKLRVEIAKAPRTREELVAMPCVAAFTPEGQEQMTKALKTKHIVIGNMQWVVAHAVPPHMEKAVERIFALAQAEKGELQVGREQRTNIMRIAGTVFGIENTAQLSKDSTSFFHHLHNIHRLQGHFGRSNQPLSLLSDVMANESMQQGIRVQLLPLRGDSDTVAYLLETPEGSFSEVISPITEFANSVYLCGPVKQVNVDCYNKLLELTSKARSEYPQFLRCKHAEEHLLQYCTDKELCKNDAVASELQSRAQRLSKTNPEPAKQIAYILFVYLQMLKPLKPPTMHPVKHSMYQKAIILLRGDARWIEDAYQYKPNRFVTAKKA